MRLIDADALKEEIRREVGENRIGVFVAKRIFKLIDNAPTVEPKQGEWIPVSERLPIDRDWYLGVFREPDTGFIGVPYICDYVGKVTKGTTKEGWILRGFTDIENANDYTKSLECVAWQPLPEPYKKGGAE